MRRISLVVCLLMLAACENNTVEKAFALKHDKKYDAAAKILNTLSEKGDLAAYTELGVLYQEKDYSHPELAFKAYKSAAALGGVWANRQVGNMYVEGNGTEKNVGYSESYLNYAAEHEDVSAMSKLVTLYQSDLSYRDPSGSIAKKWALSTWEHGRSSGGFDMTNMSLRDQNLVEYEAWALATFDAVKLESPSIVRSIPEFKYKDSSELATVMAKKRELLARYRSREIPNNLFPWRDAWKKAD